MSSEEIIVQDHERADTNVTARQTAFPRFGCIVMILLGAFFVGILIAGILIGSQMAEDIESFTDQSPKKIPAERGAPEEPAAIRQRILAFLDGMRNAPGTPVRLSLSPRELNILVANDSYLADLRGTIHFRKFSPPDIIHTERARPMTHIKFWEPRRYLNAFMDYKLVAQEGNISLFAETISIDDRKIPDYFLQKFQSQDMLDPYKNDERFPEALKLLKDAWIEDNRLILSNTSRTRSTGDGKGP
ncbi:MAG: hypothetical protein VYB61_02340 [Verrucomicrobiota bacterium]|nr:hypothetical protein [Verrucomicrobiota bacterium]